MSLSVELMGLGGNLHLILPLVAARHLGFRPGTFVRVIMLEKEIRIRPVSESRVDDGETLEEYRERLLKLEAPGKW